jgi:hypothetical protein
VEVEAVVRTLTKAQEAERREVKQPPYEDRRTKGERTFTGSWGQVQDACHRVHLSKIS